MSKVSNIVWSEHAQERALQRGCDVRMARRAIAKAAADGKLIGRGTIKILAGGAVLVCQRQGSRSLVVITVLTPDYSTAKLKSPRGAKRPRVEPDEDQQEWRIR